MLCIKTSKCTYATAAHSPFCSTLATAMLSRSIARRVAVPMYSHRFLSQVAVMKVIRGSGPKTQGPFDVKRVTPDYSTAIAARDIAKDEIIGTTHGTIYSAPTRFTIQMSDTKHVEIFGGMEYANHSCNPNALFIMSETDPVVTLVAIKPIAKGIIHRAMSSRWNSWVHSRPRHYL
ncbi:hypothetical protein AC1031_021220 [Aphanomyces cochlioides]|nr:hypothetical protein AC1031_021220 [Aphanomyces cochlioides]